MEVNDEMIQNLADLARLHFDEAEKQSIKKDLELMIGFVGKLSEIDTEGIEPQLHMSDETDIFREDELQGSVSREEALRNAPQSDGIYFKVPNVIRGSQPGFGKTLVSGPA
jgi:aspartyl-tRNA(Asn)/glutamyl-tRNA(Gln) amidotransferase subunit C